jgi:4-amino-4-deoxychorismate lyase
MSRFIETIRVDNGRIPELERHLTRLRETLRLQSGVMPAGLEAAIIKQNFPSNGRYRLRIEYGLDEDWQMETFPYMRKKIEKMRIMHFAPPDYRFKYADRAWLDTLLRNSGADEALIISNNKLTDTTIANIVFTDGNGWWTPDTPLLAGTERTRLLEAGIISERSITLSDIISFAGYRLINAMMPWEDDVTYQMSTLIFQ